MDLQEVEEDLQEVEEDLRELEEGLQEEVQQHQNHQRLTICYQVVLNVLMLILIYHQTNQCLQHPHKNLNLMMVKNVI